MPELLAVEPFGGIIAMEFPMHSLRQKFPGSKASPLFTQLAQDVSLNDGGAAADTEPRNAILRQHNRLRIRINALLYSGKTFQSVVIRDVSQGGAGLQNCSSFIANDQVTIKLMNGRSITAEVRWWLAGACGVRFIEALRPDDALLTRVPLADSTNLVLQNRLHRVLK